MNDAAAVGAATSRSAPTSNARGERSRRGCRARGSPRRRRRRTAHTPQANGVIVPSKRLSITEPGRAPPAVDTVPSSAAAIPATCDSGSIPAVLLSGIRIATTGSRVAMASSQVDATTAGALSLFSPWIVPDSETIRAPEASLFGLQPSVRPLRLLEDLPRVVDEHGVDLLLRDAAALERRDHVLGDVQVVPARHHLHRFVREPVDEA